MTRINMPTQSYWLESTPQLNERLVNLYAEAVPIEGRSPAIVYSTSGLSVFSTLGSGPVFEMNGDFDGRTYIISGSHWYQRVDADNANNDLGDIGATINVGTDTTRTTHPTLAVGTLGAVACAPPNAYYCPHGNGTAVQIDFSGSASPAGASSVAFIDGYFVFTSYDGTLFFSTNVLSTGFNALYYASADQVGGLISFCTIYGGEVWFFGRRNITVWYDAGTEFFPFANRQVDIPWTCTNTRTVAQIHGKMLWVTDDGVVVMVDGGYNVRRVSHFALEEYLRRSISFDLADGFCYAEAGHDFYVLTVPSSQTGIYGPVSWVYDMTTGFWHERQSGTYANYIGCSAAIINSRYMIGDRYNGNVYILDEGLGTENGMTMTRTMVTAPIWADTNRAFMSSFEAETQTGLTSTTASQILLEISDDGGTTWRTRGELPYNATRTRWTRMGSFRQRSLRLTANDRVVYYGLDAQIVEGTS